ncbi:sugar diacid recognition domain-containing protein [Streptomyces sp. GLT-R25]
MLSPSLAQEIAGDTSAVIGFNVLITDADGMVIGSGDTHRVGTFHEASVEVIRTQEPGPRTTRRRPIGSRASARVSPCRWSPTGRPWGRSGSPVRPARCAGSACW